MMKKWFLAALVGVPAAIGGLVFAGSPGSGTTDRSTVALGYICPATGEELPCPNCCPLKR